MKKAIVRTVILLALAVGASMVTASVGVSAENFQPTSETQSRWQSPPAEVLAVMHAQPFPRAWTAPTGQYLLLADPALYPPLAELAAPMHKLAGIRVNPVSNGYHGHRGSTSPRLVRIEDGTTTELVLPEAAEVYDVRWTATGQRFALIVRHADHIGLWVGSVAGELTPMAGVALNPLLGNPVSWLPDQQRLLVRRLPQRGPAPEPPAIPTGPDILEGAGALARSTYEARNLLETAHDDALFEYYIPSELAIIDPKTKQIETIAPPAPYTLAQFSPSGEYLLIQRLVGPWSHEVTWRRFASEIEVWNATGEQVRTIAALPVADSVPVHGVPKRPAIGGMAAHGSAYPLLGRSVGRRQSRR